MRKIPIFTLIAAFLLGASYLYYHHAKSRVELNFNFAVDKKLSNYTISGRIDGAGDKVITLPLAKSEWQSVKKGKYYTINLTFYNKKTLDQKDKAKLQGPFWLNQANQGLLVNKVKVIKIEEADF
ncbi:hypothetical protein [Listeria sp. PSOL-1]|uniref:hypothetical protein n=1 Tax=Listeria sp. PSOL-1 TaxID=1844999 RepID=UPI0013D229F2|nr:hypothetical protein [Listeria sp. PSOL-1]